MIMMIGSPVSPTDDKIIGTFMADVSRPVGEETDPGYTQSSIDTMWEVPNYLGGCFAFFCTVSFSRLTFDLLVLQIYSSVPSVHCSHQRDLFQTTRFWFAVLMLQLVRPAFRETPSPPPPRG